jgi:hypothetical protein
MHPNKNKPSDLHLALEGKRESHTLRLPKNGRHFLVMFEPPKHFVLSDVSLARHWPVM